MKITPQSQGALLTLDLGHSKIIQMLDWVPMLADLAPSPEIFEAMKRNNTTTLAIVGGVGVVALAVVVLAIRSFRRRRK